MATERQKNLAWDKAKKIKGRNPELYRRDEYGNEIYFNSYGLHGNKSWEVDHKKPVSKGGTDNPKNLRALKTEDNRHKSDKYPAKKKR